MVDIDYWTVAANTAFSDGDHLADLIAKMKESGLSRDEIRQAIKASRFVEDDTIRGTMELFW